MSEAKAADNDAPRWCQTIQDYDVWSKRWHDRAKKIVRRYRDERMDQSFASGDVRPGNRRFNIFWSNIEVLKPATYARLPKPVVERRFRDSDPVGRVASDILERATTFATDADAFNEVLRSCRDDYLIVGRGEAWVRYVPHFAEQPEGSGGDETQDDGVSITDDAAEHEESAGDDDDAEGEGDEEPDRPEPTEQLAFEEVAFDYVAWADFGFTPARRWDEVSAVWRRVQMTRAEMVERFGDIAKTIPLDSKPDVGPADDEAARMRVAMHSRANIYEIWDRPGRRVVWLSITDGGTILDVRPDPLNLDGFFPCPRPMFATLTTDSLIPVPDFVYYQDQADQLDDIVQRLSLLTDACKVRGLYDSSQDSSIGRLLQEGGDNALIPVDTWAMFAEKGGIKGVIDFMPLESVVAAIAQLQARSESVKAEIYEITGIADIVRGYSAPSETATAQQIKGQFAALRLQDRQQEVARFARDLIALAAEIISEHFSEQTIALMVGAAEQPPDWQQSFMPAVQLLRNDAMRNFRVEIETDSTVAIDERTEKQQATELLAAMGAFLKDVAPVGQMAPALLPLLGQMLLYGVRRFRGGRNLEGAVESAFKNLEGQAQQAQQMQQMQAQQPPPPDPAMLKAQAQIEAGKQKMNADLTEQAARLQADVTEQQARMDADLALKAYGVQAAEQRASFGGEA